MKSPLKIIILQFSRITLLLLVLLYFNTCRPSDYSINNLEGIPKDISFQLYQLNSPKLKITFLLNEVEKQKISAPQTALVLTKIVMLLTAENKKFQLEYAESLYWFSWITLRNWPYSENYRLSIAHLKICQYIFETKKENQWLVQTHDLLASAYGYQVNSQELDKKGYADSIRTKANFHMDQAFSYLKHKSLKTFPDKDLLEAELWNTKGALYYSLKKRFRCHFLSEKFGSI